MVKRKRAERNRTLSISAGEISQYKKRLIRLQRPTKLDDILNKTICQDIFEVSEFLPEGFADLLFIDPPYNLDKKFNGKSFRRKTLEDYAGWVDEWLGMLIRILKPTASIYICSDWRSSTAVHTVAQKYFKVRNRITWEREKGRGALSNWKNCSEDIWFCTMSDKFTFNVDAVKIKRKVIAPYTENGRPKDWEKSEKGIFRLTFPSNIWTDLTVPFWSMPENTEHPTQKPEKLLAKIILASSKAGDIVFDPFCGSGTTSAAAKKLGRNFVGVEMDEMYCCLAEKRLAMADLDKTIQGYSEGVFRERNMQAEPQPKKIRHRLKN
jgi:site-specific DNA-methyltransferase (adenine-specific)